MGICFSLHRGCMGDDSSKRVVEVLAWCIAHVRHTRVNTSVGTVYIIFWFSTYQNPCICIMFSKSICSIKEHWWSLTSSWPDEVQRVFSTTHGFFKHSIDTTNDFHEIFFFICDQYYTYFAMFYLLYVMFNSSSPSTWLWISFIYIHSSFV